MKTKNFLLLSLSVMLVSACNAQVAIPSLVPSGSPTATVTAIVLSPVESTPSPTSTSVPAMTSTPLPSLSPDDREKMLAELLQTNGSCSTPCFWGISPGVSNFDDAVSFLKSLGRRGLEGIKDSTQYYNVTYNFKDETSIINVVLLKKNESLAEIGASLDGLQSEDISSSDWPAFRPDSIIKTYGIPSSIKIGLGEGPDGLMVYQLLFTYDSAKLNILYSPTDNATLPAAVLHTCPLAEHGISKLDFWLGHAPEDLSAGMKEIEEVSPLTVEEFSYLIINRVLC